jgi:hypothetical protein
MDPFWALYEKNKRGFLRYPSRITLEGAPHLRDRLSERDVRFLDQVGLPAAKDLLGACYFTPAAFFEEHMGAGTNLGFLGAWPLIHCPPNEVLVVRADQGRTFFHASGVAHAVLLPIMIEETLLKVDDLASRWRNDVPTRNQEILKEVAVLESDLGLLDPRLLTEHCFWPYELFRIGCDFGAPMPRLLQGLPEEADMLF